MQLPDTSQYSPAARVLLAIAGVFFLLDGLYGVFARHAGGFMTVFFAFEAVIGGMALFALLRPRQDDPDHRR